MIDLSKKRKTMNDFQFQAGKFDCKQAIKDISTLLCAATCFVAIYISYMQLSDTQIAPKTFSSTQVDSVQNKKLTFYVDYPQKENTKRQRINVGQK